MVEKRFIISLQCEERMSMACSSLFSPNSLPSFTTRPTRLQISYEPNNLAFSSLRYNTAKKKVFPLASVASIPYQPINVDYLEEEFSGHGVTFEDIDGSCVAKMGLENGSTATLMLPSGLITSYKAHMWHGGAVELLHTIVSEGKDGATAIQGGVSLAFSCVSDGEVWSLCNWTLHDIRGNPQDSIQVELISSDTVDMVEIRCTVTLNEGALNSELLVSNFRSSSLQLAGSIISHLTVSTPEANYAVGLEGSDFFNISPVSSNFVIIPPDNSEENNFIFSPMRFLSGLGARNEKVADAAHSSFSENDEEMQGEENDNYKQLTEKMSRIYTSAPTNFTIIDRGRRNSVVAGRNGFDELYILSPGSSHEFYGKYSYLCIGASAILKPIMLRPGDLWKGGQQLHNPNL